jgi:hypothetical protein
MKIEALTSGPFDMDAMRSIVFTPGSLDNPEDQTKIEMIYLRLMNAKSDSFSVKYDPPARGIGNLVAKGPNIQNFNKHLRPLITKILYDIDIRASGMTIMSQVFDRHNIPCPLLKSFIDPINRERTLNRINRNDRDAAKQVVERLFNGGKPTDTDPDWLIDMAGEFKSCRDDFYDLCRIVTTKYT